MGFNDQPWARYSNIYASCFANMRPNYAQGRPSGTCCLNLIHTLVKRKNVHTNHQQKNIPQNQMTLYVLHKRTPQTILWPLLFSVTNFHFVGPHFGPAAKSQTGFFAKFK